MYGKGLYPQNVKRTPAAIWRKAPQGILTYNRENGVSQKCLVECLRVSNMHASVCVLLITILKYIFSLFFSKCFLLCVWVNFIPAPLLIIQFHLFKGWYTRTHPHTHTSLKTKSKIGRWLGRKPYHPTCPAGTLVRYPHHLIVWQPIRYPHHPIISW